MEALLTRSEGLLHDNLGVTEDGVLTVAGQRVTDLRETYGTPLYLMDEDKIRSKCRTYLTAVKQAFGDRARVLYASKALSFKRIYEIMREEGMGIDVVSSGEIATAKAAGYPMERAFFHSNNKTDADIAYAMDAGVGYFVVDNEEELYAIERIATARECSQSVLLRITPGIDPHTYAAVATGKVDSKFGSAIETGQAEAITAVALSLAHVRLCGFHCHVGSQVFDSEVYLKAADVMLGFLAAMQKKLGYTADILDLGGGYGVRYVESDPQLDIAANIAALAETIKERAAAYGVRLPEFAFEPGRSIVADAGVTLYTVGTVKRIPGYKNYVSVDGGMTDSPRYILYGSRYTLLPADRMHDARDMTASVVGRCCESGDIIQENVPMPETIARGDLIATLTTGAYHYSMASNYNRIPRPPIVMLRDGESYVAVRRETVEDILACDL